MIAAWGMILAVAGASLLYLASPNQRAIARALPGKSLAAGGGVLLVGGLALLLQWAGPATAVFIWLTLAMLVWSVAPPLAAWLRRAGGEAR